MRTIEKREQSLRFLYGNGSPLVAIEALFWIRMGRGRRHWRLELKGDDSIEDQRKGPGFKGVIYHDDSCSSVDAKT